MERMRLATYLTNKYKEKLLEDHRYTLQQFADYLNIKRENLAGYMSPKRKNRQPRIDQCVKMAKGLGLSLIEFLVQSGLATVDEADQTKKPGIPEDLPDPVRIAMSTPEWETLCVCPDEIEAICSLPNLTNSQSVIQGVRRLPWRVIKRLFLEHHAPSTIQESCVHYCQLVVSDWEQRSSSSMSA